MAAMGTTLGNGFQSTLPRGERLVKPCCLKYPFNFNPRSREGSDKRHSRNMFETIDFNPRSREGSDLHRFRHVLVVVGISIHAPARGATFCHLLALLNTRNFNPRSREGSDSTYGIVANDTHISIHAPARGATSSHPCRIVNAIISIHAPARGATHTIFYVIKICSISIHAPARGATSATFTFPAHSRSFQSTLPRGERLSRSSPFDRPRRFQSTLPRGERRYVVVRQTVFYNYFNPRSREGSDTIDVTLFTYSIISIHAPARGATPPPNRFHAS